MQTIRGPQTAGPAERAQEGDKRFMRTLERGRRVLQLEAEALSDLVDRLDESFVRAVETVAHCSGKIVVTGMGKAGLIGQKIAATLSSTGTSAIFLHPAEAMHGDLGMVDQRDVVLALSNSGRTEELQRLFPSLREIGVAIVLLTGAPDSPCGKGADIVLDIGSVPEACPLGLAPSSSTTAMLGLGDAVALSVLEAKGLAPERYAKLHPAGELGRKLMTVEQIMRTGSACPRVMGTATILESLDAIANTPERAGAVSIVDEEGKLTGFFTDGDLRRLVRSGKLIEARDAPIQKAMTPSPKTARQDDLVLSACETLRRYKIDELPVVDEAGRLVGVLDVQDLLLAGFSVADPEA